MNYKLILIACMIFASPCIERFLISIALVIQGIGGAAMVALYRLAEQSQTTIVKIPAEKIFISDAIFNEIKERAKTEKNLSQDINSSFRFIITRPDNAVKQWLVDCKVTPATVTETDKGNADVEMTMNETDFVSIVTGKLRPDQAFLQRKLKIKGNLAKAMKLRKLVKPGMLKAKL